jgi:hypothetical protein
MTELPKTPHDAFVLNTGKDEDERYEEETLSIEEDET